MTTDSYYGLLTQPPGLYGLTPYGGTCAISLTGSEQFQDRAYNLFLMGADSDRGGMLESRPPEIHKSERPDTVWFCLPKERVVQALRLYLYGQLFQAKGDLQSIQDDEGDFVETVCLNEDALMAEAAELAATFVAIEMTPDYSALPRYKEGIEPLREHKVAAGFGAGAED